jgi:hypothetical protein
MPTKKSFLTLARPAFVVDWHAVVRDTGRVIDWPNVGNAFRDGGVKVDVGAAGAGIGATSIPVSPALAGPIPAGAVLDFGTNKFARLTAAAVTGATTLTVAALPTALVDADVAYYWEPGAPKYVKGGTVMGELLGAGKISPRIVTTNPASCILLADAREDAVEDALSGYGILLGGPIYENLLPDATGGPPATLPAAFKTELAAAAGATGFGWHTYQDTTT